MVAEFSISSTTRSRSSRNILARIGWPLDFRNAINPAMIVLSAPKTVINQPGELLAPMPVKAAPSTTCDNSKVLVRAEVNAYILP
jgi:hypothetical protein